MSPANSSEDIKEGQKGIDDYLTAEERKRLLASLHHALVWVGVKEPAECQIGREAIIEELEKYGQTKEDLPPEVHPDKGVVDLHRFIWRLINEEEITDRERVQIQEIIDLLEKKERKEEEELREEKLTRYEASQLYNEAASVIRALIDLKDILKRGEHEIKEKTAKEKAKTIRDFADRYAKGEIE
jgi:hypothetical protein